MRSSGGGRRRGYQVDMNHKHVKIVVVTSRWLRRGEAVIRVLK